MSIDKKFELFVAVDDDGIVPRVARRVNAAIACLLLRRVKMGGIGPK